MKTPFLKTEIKSLVVLYAELSKMSMSARIRNVTPKLVYNNNVRKKTKHQIKKTCDYLDVDLREKC